MQEPTVHLANMGCSKCGTDNVKLIRSKDSNYFIEKATLVHGDKYDYYSLINYINRNTLITIICKIHGAFNQLPFNHYQGKGCLKCRTSYGESHIATYLDSRNVVYETQKRFNECKNIFALPFDFYIPALNALIEYDGCQHFVPIEIWGGIEALEKTQENDAIKNEFAAPIICHSCA